MLSSMSSILVGLCVFVGTKERKLRCVIYTIALVLGVGTGVGAFVLYRNQPADAIVLTVFTVSFVLLSLKLARAK